MNDVNERSDASIGSVAYRTFDDWYSEIEGFSLRGERLDGPVDELRAAFAAGQSGLRLTDAEREAVARAAQWMVQLAKDRGEIHSAGYVCDDAATLRGLLERMK